MPSGAEGEVEVARAASRQIAFEVEPFAAAAVLRMRETLLQPSGGSAKVAVPAGE